MLVGLDTVALNIGFFLTELVLALVWFVTVVYWYSALLWQLWFLLFFIVNYRSLPTYVERLGRLLLEIAFPMYLLNYFFVLVLYLFYLLLQVLKLLMQQNYLLRPVLILWCISNVHYSILVVVTWWWVYLRLCSGWVKFIALALKWTHFLV